MSDSQIQAGGTTSAAVEPGALQIVAEKILAFDVTKPSDAALLAKDNPFVPDLAPFFETRLLAGHVGPGTVGQQFPVNQSFIVLTLKPVAGVDARVRSVEVALQSRDPATAADPAKLGDPGLFALRLAEQQLLFDPPSPVVETLLLHHDASGVRAFFASLRVRFDLVEDAQTSSRTFLEGMPLPEL